jgi:hypothetical protein
VRAQVVSLVGAFFTRLIFGELEEEFVFKKDRCSQQKTKALIVSKRRARGAFQVFRQVRDVHSLVLKSVSKYLTDGVVLLTTPPILRFQLEGDFVRHRFFIDQVPGFV